jgi:hypothetical protein
MAADPIETKTDGSTDEEEKETLIDSVYQQFVRGVVGAIGSTEFYEYFMEAISRAQNEFQFSNRKMVKTIDTSWVDAVEESLNAMQNIIATPRNVIAEEDLIVNVANAKKSSAETVRHLAQHSSLVDTFDEEHGDVRPGKLMQRFREESIGLYENRLVFTTIETAYHFVKIRHDALLEAMSDEFGAKLKVKSDMDSATEHMHMDLFLHIKKTDSILDTDQKNGDTLSRISRLYRVLSAYMNTDFAQQMTKLSRVKGSINRTNVLKKNKDYKSVVSLYEFLRQYDQVGYTIQIVEQNPTINEKFQQDIYRNILFNYLILKGYLEDEEDRKLPEAARGRKRTLKPKFIRQIIEELTEDYDLPDVEVRKVLIEELTKEQLMKEEAAERRRLVEEQRQRKKEEEDKKRAEKKAEQERLKAERAAEREQKQKEKEEEEARKQQEKMARDGENRRFKRIFEEELNYFENNLNEMLEKRQEVEEKQQAQLVKREDFEDAVRFIDWDEQRKLEEKARELERKQAEEEERQRIEREAEEERLRLAQEAEEARLNEEKRRIAAECLKPLADELRYYHDTLNSRMRTRKTYMDYFHDLQQKSGKKS